MAVNVEPRKPRLVAITRRRISLKSSLRYMFIGLFRDVGPDVQDRLDRAWLAGWRAHGTYLRQREEQREQAEAAKTKSRRRGRRTDRKGGA